MTTPTKRELKDKAQELAALYHEARNWVAAAAIAYEFAQSDAQRAWDAYNAAPPDGTEDE